MEQWTPPASGTLRISNPRTLQSWIDKGLYQEYLNDGWIFNVGCGRFKKEVCTCSQCRNRKRKSLQDIIDRLNQKIQNNKNEIKSILFKYSDEHGLLSCKQDIEKFNGWITENL